jgi:type I restriction enzyme S subunit
MAAVEEAKKAAQQRLEAAKALPAAYLREVFEGEEAKGWAKVLLETISTFAPARSISTNGDTTVTAVTTACLSESGFLSDGLKEARMMSSAVSMSVIQPKDVLIARSNTAELVGRVSMFPSLPDSDRDIVASDLVIRIIADKAHLIPEFLTKFLSYLFLTGYWRNIAGGASGSMKNITRTHLRSLEVPCPPSETQSRIESELEDKVAGVKLAEASIQQELDTIEAMPAALLRKAFSGNL